MREDFFVYTRQHVDSWKWYQVLHCLSSQPFGACSIRSSCYSTETAFLTTNRYGVERLAGPATCEQEQSVVLHLALYGTVRQCLLSLYGTSLSLSSVFSFPRTLLRVFLFLCHFLTLETAVHCAPNGSRASLTLVWDRTCEVQHLVQP